MSQLISRKDCPSFCLSAFLSNVNNGIVVVEYSPLLRAHGEMRDHSMAAQTFLCLRERHIRLGVDMCVCVYVSVCLCV